MGYMEYHVYLNTDVAHSLSRIIEEGLISLGAHYDEQTFEVDCTGNEV